MFICTSCDVSLSETMVNCTLRLAHLHVSLAMCHYQKPGSISHCTSTLTCTCSSSDVSFSEPGSSSPCTDTLTCTSSDKYYQNQGQVHTALVHLHVPLAMCHYQNQGQFHTALIHLHVPLAMCHYQNQGQVHTALVHLHVPLAMCHYRTRINISMHWFTYVYI